MTTPEASIWIALRTKLAALTLSPALTIAWPNEIFTKPDLSGVPTDYLEVTLFRNKTVTASLSSTGYNRHSGILQIKLITKLDQDAAVGMDIAGTIAAHFKPNQAAFSHGGVNVRIEDPPTVGSAIPGDAMAEIPISVSYFAHVQRT